MNRRSFLASLPVIAAAPSVLKAAAQAPSLTVAEILQDTLDGMRLSIYPPGKMRIISPCGTYEKVLAFSSTGEIELRTQLRRT